MSLKETEVTHVKSIRWAEIKNHTFKEQVRLCFDTGAASRDPFKDPFNSFTYRRKRRDIVRLLHENVKDILDLGCGIGTFEEILKLYANKSNY